MRYLRAPNQFQLRLGWLSVIAALVGDRRCSRADMERGLIKLALEGDVGAQSRWLAEADLGMPQGRLSPRAVSDVVRMATVYGVYDPDAQALTDLGQVLLAATHWTKAASPFVWKGAARFVGTRILLGGNGDMALEILRRFPPAEELSLSKAPEFLADCLERLTLRTRSDQEWTELFMQAERARDPGFRERVHRALVYPHFEPLRELGYLTLFKKETYVRTELGARFISSAPKGGADDLLWHGLPSAVLHAEGVSPLVPADPEALRQTLLHLPGPLSGAHAEASLEPVVLLTQVRLITEEPGRWIDLERAAELMAAIERRTEGRIGLKSGRSREEQNVTWRERGYLEDARMWDIAVPPAPPTGDAGSDSSSRAPGSSESAEQPRPMETSEHERPEPAEPPATTTPAPEAQPEEEERPAHSAEPEISQSAPPPPPENLPQAPLNPHALLWLSYVERLLAPPTLGDVGGIRRGGPLSWVTSLRKLLDIPEDKLKGKRSPIDEKDSRSEAHGRHTIATSALHRWLDRLDGTIEVRAFAECARAWAPGDGMTGPHPDSLRGAFLWAEMGSGRLTTSLVGLLLEFVQRSEPVIRWDGWDAVREATRGLIDDALHLGLWHAPELLARLGSLRDEDCSQAAKNLIEELTGRTQRRKFNFTQEFSVPAALLQVLDELGASDQSVQLEDATVDMSRSLATTFPSAFQTDSGTLDEMNMPADDAQPRDEASADATEGIAARSPQSTSADLPKGSALSVSVELKARTEEQAMSRGAEYAAEAVSRLAFLGTLRAPPGAAGNVASIRPEDDGRLIDEQGSLYKPPTRRETGIFVERPDDIGIRQLHPIDGGLIGVVQKLPALAAIDRGVALDGRARLARSLHWLALADAPHLRPAERLSHGWVAFEHLFADGAQKGHLVAELSAPVVVLCFMRAAAGRLYRDVLAALHVSACRSPAEGPLHGLVERWLGPNAWSPYVTRGPGPVVPLPDQREIRDEEGLKLLLESRADYKALATAVEEHVPLVAWQLRSLDQLLDQRSKLAAWLRQRERDAASFLMGVYEVRNQLVHDANPFGFDDAYRLRNLYERYRVTINPVVAEVLRLVGSDLSMPLKHAWALLSARFVELLAHQGDPKARGAADRNKTADPVIIKALLGCLS